MQRDSVRESQECWGREFVICAALTSPRNNIERSGRKKPGRVHIHVVLVIITKYSRPAINPSSQASKQNQTPPNPATQCMKPRWPFNPGPLLV